MHDGTLQNRMAVCDFTTPFVAFTQAVFPAAVNLWGFFEHETQSAYYFLDSCSPVFAGRQEAKDPENTYRQTRSLGYREWSTAYYHLYAAPVLYRGVLRVPLSEH